LLIGTHDNVRGHSEQCHLLIKATCNEYIYSKCTNGKCTNGKCADGKCANGKYTDGKCTDRKYTDCTNVFVVILDNQ